MTLHDAADPVGFAAVIDDLGAAAGHRAIEGPVVVHREQVGECAVAAPFRLAPINALPGIFDYLAPGGDPFFRVDAIAVNPRPPDRDFETSVARIDGRRLYWSGSHVSVSMYSSGMPPAAPDRAA